MTFVVFVVDSLQPCLASRTTATLDHLFAVRVVVVGELFTRLDVAPRADPDRMADDLAVAVGAARVVDEARIVAVRAGIAHPLPIDREAPDLTALQVLRFTLQAFLVVDQFARVIDDPSVLVDWLKCEDAPPVQFRSPPRHARQLRFPRHVNDRIASADR